MKTIWKYPLPSYEKSEITLKKGAKILSAGIQFERLTIWAEVDPSGPETKRRFRVQSTGGPLPDDREEGVFIDTVFHKSSVFHIFDLGEVEQ